MAYRAPHKDKDGNLTIGPRQIEFARLNITRTIMSKRYLRRLVEEHYVSGWDDPRMPTLCAMRRRGFTPAAIRDFVERVGLAKADSEVEYAMLEHCVREDLGGKAKRAMAVVNPLKIILTNWEAGKTETLKIENHPDHPELGERDVTISREVYIDADDFREEPPKKFFRLKPDGEVRLKGAYIIKCEKVVKDASGAIDHLECTVDYTSKSGTEGAERKVKGTLQWVDAGRCEPIEFRLYEPLLNDEAPETDEETDKKDFISRLNPNSLTVKNGFGEAALKDAKPGDTFQFLRVGYFCKDKDSTDDKAVFNRVVGLKDSYKPV